MATTALQTTTKPAKPIAIRFSSECSKTVERYRADLDADHFDATLVRPEDGPALLAAADEHRALLVPASADFVKSTLLGLRSATIVKQEHGAEAEASFAILRNHLADVPADILQEACRAYVNVPGKRFFPRSAGELRAFILPLAATRSRREWRLRKMAEAADHAAREAARLAETEEIPLDEIRAWPRATAEAALVKGWITESQLAAAHPAPIIEGEEA
ncbi:hypothetical protein [Sphingomonas montanisoli]|uniref:Uncharacterized protein n=1 Tax=Sphingomonas montanisoli TaxID=2606412 RepID=A0A5D9C2V8_9SPHN|nr:hypothetical protein [Sphingomonas montanisoli]TZG25597.1 hypothetical protein FYJ91_11260 [Sphingomonas montanisoli]